MSKLCCPVCWELMKILKKDSADDSLFDVRGRHPTLCSVQLPYWLPAIVMEQMNERFRSLTIKQLHMMQRQSVRDPKTHNRTASESNQSDDGVSTASISSGGSGYMEPNIEFLKAPLWLQE